MDALLERHWGAAWMVAGLLVVLSLPEGPSLFASGFYVLALGAFPFGMRARSLHAGPPRTPWRSAVVRWTTGGPSRWLLVVAYAAVAGWVSWSRYEMPWHVPLSVLVAAVAAYVTTAPLVALAHAPGRH